MASISFSCPPFFFIFRRSYMWYVITMFATTCSEILTHVRTCSLLRIFTCVICISGGTANFFGSKISHIRTNGDKIVSICFANPSRKFATVFSSTPLQEKVGQRKTAADYESESAMLRKGLKD